jgi:Chromosome segregation ATPases
MSKENSELVRLFYQSSYNKKLLSIADNVGYNPVAISKLISDLENREDHIKDIMNNNIKSLGDVLREPLLEIQRQIAELKSLLPSDTRESEVLADRVQKVINDELNLYFEKFTKPMLDNLDRLHKDFYAQIQALKDIGDLLRSGGGGRSSENIKSDLQTITAFIEKHKDLHVSELAEIRQYFDTITKQLAETNTNLANLKVKDSTDLQQKNRELINQLNELKSSISQQPDYGELLLKYQASERLLQEKTAIEEQLSDRLSQNESTIRQLRDELKGNVSNITAGYEKRISALEDEIKRKESFLKQVELEAEKNRENFDGERVQLNTQISSLLSRLEELQQSTDKEGIEASRLQLSQVNDTLDACKRDKDELTEKIVTLTAHEAALQQELKELQLSCAENTNLIEQITSLKETILQNERIRADLENQLESKNTEIETLRASVGDIDILQQQLLQCRDDQAKGDEEIKAMKENELKLKEEIDKLRSDKTAEETEKKLLECQKELMNLKSDKKALSTEISQKADEIKRLKSQIRDLQKEAKKEGESSALLRQMEGLRKSLEECRTQKASLENEVVQLKEADSVCKEELAKLKQDISTSKTSIGQMAALEAELEVLKEEQDTMLKNIEEKERETQRIKKELDDMKIPLTDAQKKLMELNEELEKCREEKKKCEEKLSRLEKVAEENDELKERVESLQKEKDNLKGDIVRLTDEMKNVGENVTRTQVDCDKKKEDLENERQRLEKELETAKNTEQTTKKELGDLVNELESNKNELSKLKTDLDAISKERNGLSEKIVELNQEIALLRNTLAERTEDQKEAEALKIQLDNNKNERDELEQKNAELLAKEIAAKQEIERLNQTSEERDNLLSQLESLRNELSALKDEKTSLTEKLSEKDAEILRLQELSVQKENDLQTKCRTDQDVLRTELSNRENELNTLRNRIQTLQTELEELVKSKGDQEKLQHDLETISGRLQEEIVKNENLINTTLAECEERVSNIKQNYENQLLEKEKIIEEKENILKDLNERVLQQETEINVLKEQVTEGDDKSKLIEELQTRIEELTKELSDSESNCLRRIEEKVNECKEECLRSQQKYISDFENKSEDFQKLCEEKKRQAKEIILRIRSLKELFIQKLNRILDPKVNEAKLNIKVRKTRREKLNFFQDMKDNLSTLLKDIDNVGDIDTAKCDSALEDMIARLEALNITFSKDYLEVSDLYESMRGVGRVYLRIKPRVLAEQYSEVKVVDIVAGKTKVQFNYSNGSPGKVYGPYDKIYGPEIFTKDIFDDLRSLIDGLERGYNLMLLTYGQSGSGKTYTLFGSQPSTEGILGLVLNYMQSLGIFTDIMVQMYQLYMGDIYDIIDAESIQRRHGAEETFPLPAKKYTPGFLDRMPSKPIGAFSSSGRTTGLDLLNYIGSRRFQRETYLNPDSSRSHAFIVLNTNVGGNNVKVIFCDLGGNERIREHEGAGSEKSLVYREGLYIINTLSDLRNRILPNFTVGKPIKASMQSGDTFKKVLNFYLKFEETSPLINKVMMFIHVHGFYKEGVINEIIEDTTIDTLEFASTLTSK